MSSFHLAQINIAKALAPMESEVMASFVNRLDEINALADTSNGFVWRLQDEEGNATAIQAYDDPSIIVNLSVWQSIEQLRHFVYQTAHVELIRDRDAWFSKFHPPHMALWWLPQGHTPTVAEGKEKLALLQANGSSQYAFTFAKPFSFPA